MMGIDVDTVGNHSFDPGQTYYRTQLLTLADFPVLSSNITYPDGKYPKEWQPSTVIKFPGGVDLGIVGFTTESTPGVVFPGNLDPFVVRPVIPAVNAAVKALPHADAVVALGHEGANAGTVTDPTGPLIDIADGVQGVDVVIGDHNDLQVDAVRPNGVLVTENRAKGVRFTRVRMVVGPGKDGVVYKTADYHKPFNIGLTPDPAIQAKIDALNAQLAPILNVQIGASTKAIPRTDQCGNTAGRHVRVAGRQRGHRRDADDVQPASACSSRSRTRAVSATTLTCPTVDIGGDFCPSFAPPPFPITRGQSLTRAPVREHRGDARRQRRRAEDDARERRLPHADGRRALPAGVRPLLHVRHRATGREPGHRGRAGRQRRQLHGDGDQPDGGRRPYKIAENDFMVDRRRRLSELRQPHDDAGHHGAGRRPTTSRRTRR